MAHSVEGRFPFLDPNRVALAKLGNPREKPPVLLLGDPIETRGLAKCAFGLMVVERVDERQALIEEAAEYENVSLPTLMEELEELEKDRLQTLEAELTQLEEGP